MKISLQSNGGLHDTQPLSSIEFWYFRYEELDPKTRTEYILVERSAIARFQDIYEVKYVLKTSFCWEVINLLIYQETLSSERWTNNECLSIGYLH